MNEVVDIAKKYKTRCGYAVTIDNFSGDPGLSHPVYGRIHGMYSKVSGRDETGAIGCWTEFGQWRADGIESEMDLIEEKGEVSI